MKESSAYLIPKILKAYLLGVGKVIGSMLGQKHVIAKDVKSCTYVRCATLIV